MAERDLYCFKSGKLELSILDEDLDEEMKEKLAYSDIESQMSYIPLDQEEPYMSSPEDDQEVNFISYSQPQLIITEEISHTLKTMSEFLMQPEAMEQEDVEENIEEETEGNVEEENVEEETEEDIEEDVEEETEEDVQEDVEDDVEDDVEEEIEEDIVEAIVEAIVEEVVYTVAEDIGEDIIEAIVEEIVEEMVEVLVEGDGIEDAVRDDKIAAIEENRMMKSFGINSTDQAMLGAKVHQDEITQIYSNSSTDQVVNMKNMQHHIKSNTAMQQRLIDDILLSHFGEITTKFPYEKELKQKIERQIYKIKSYK